jgi:hypothetical protein
MQRLKALITALTVLLFGCGFVRMAGTYSIKSMVNDATFYRARYMDNCVTQRTAGAPCAEWQIEQSKLDQAAGEATDALKVGGGEKLQLAALKNQLNVVKEKFSAWATSGK